MSKKNKGTCRDEDVGYIENPSTQRPDTEIDEVNNVTAVRQSIRKIADTTCNKQRDCENANWRNALGEQRVAKHAKQQSPGANTE